jgi:hypothetical protein
VEHQELTAKILATFDTASNFQAYLLSDIFPAFKARAAAEKKAINDARLADLVQGRIDREKLKKLAASDRDDDKLRQKGYVWNARANRWEQPRTDGWDGNCKRCGKYWSLCKCIAGKLNADGT